MMILIKLEIID